MVCLQSPPSDARHEQLLIVSKQAVDVTELTLKQSVQEAVVGGGQAAHSEMWTEPFGRGMMLSSIYT